MKKKVPYNLIWILLALTFAAGCRLNQQKKLNRRVTLWHNDKIPYGTYYAYKNLHYLFPDAEILIDNGGAVKFQNDYWWKINNNKGNVALIAITPRIDPTDEELNAIFNLINQGDHVFLSAFTFSKKFLDSFSVKDRQLTLFNFNDTLITSILHPVTYEDDSFEYPGYAYDNYFSFIDTNYVKILGRNEDGKPNFIKINYKSGGSLYLHLEPFAFTNFFLLHNNNKTYYDYALSYLPRHIKLITWGENFRDGNNGNFSALKFLLGIPAFKWAFWLLLILFLLLYLFESKRKQRAIPDSIPLRNTSLDFVKTVGRLYYQQKDNLNLAYKMSVHFLSHVRTKYNLPTSNLDKDFAERLSYKSGYGKIATKELVDYIKVIQQQQSLSDEGLLEFNKKIEEFYKQT
ncbi:MAG TPA: hypothetical protein VMT76_17240 [Puia sp.]|nr:hypothetical protein [Puia sp.]